MSFTEESSGTNAIAMSMQFKKPVYTFPNHHYCDFLRKLYLYSIPLSVNEETIGYLAIATIEQMISRELIAITELLSYKICNEYRSRPKLPIACLGINVKLSGKQLEMLKLFARGKTDKAIAIEAGLSFVTIRYHKKNIFKKLGVSCSVEAVIKALKLNLISLDQV